MEIAAWILGAVLLLWGIGAYNRLMRLRNAIVSSWAQLEAPLAELARLGQRLAELGPNWLPQEAAAFDALRAQSHDLQNAVQLVKARPYAAEPVGQLAVTQALHAAALQRVQALIEHHVHDEDAGRDELIAGLKLARQQREFGKQLFNTRVDLFNEAVAPLPTRVLAGLYGFHDAGKF